jgi:hypothetical protein
VTRPLAGKDSAGGSPGAFSTQTFGAGLGSELRI